MSGFVCVWEFEVAPEATAEFERLYGPEGDWIALFGRASGYLGSTLLRDRSSPGRYLTLDRWESEASYRAVRTQFAREYAELDRRGETLTLRETPLGEFEA